MRTWITVGDACMQCSGEGEPLLWATLLEWQPGMYIWEGDRVHWCRKRSATLTLSQAALGLDRSKQVRAAKGKMLTVDHSAQLMQEAEEGSLPGLSHLAGGFRVPRLKWLETSRVCSRRDIRISVLLLLLICRASNPEKAIHMLCSDCPCHLPAAADSRPGAAGVQRYASTLWKHGQLRWLLWDSTIAGDELRDWKSLQEHSCTQCKVAAAGSSSPTLICSMHLGPNICTPGWPSNSQPDWAVYSLHGHFVFTVFKMKEEMLKRQENTAFHAEEMIGRSYADNLLLEKNFTERGMGREENWRRHLEKEITVIKSSNANLMMMMSNITLLAGMAQFLHGDCLVGRNGSSALPAEPGET